MSPIQDRVLLNDSNLSGLPPRKRVLVWFITGNPGLIEYYRAFLTNVYDQLSHNDNKVVYTVQGTSLAGFEVNPRSPHRSDLKKPLPYNLDEQIQFMSRQLENAIREDKNGPPDDVILIGHSVGAYIALKTVELWQAPSMQQSRTWSISAVVLLFPTIVDIARSPSGKKLTPLFRFPLFPLCVHYLVKTLFLLVPLFVVTLLVRLFTLMPMEDAKITASFLKSDLGVYQALVMAKHEMAEICEDKFTDEVWGKQEVKATQERLTKEANDASSYHKHPHLHFYWGSNDHWVATETRDKLLETRAAHSASEGNNYVTMEIDIHKVPHSFCMQHSNIIADKVAQFIKQLE
ncbi:hypothetical protein K431DRAFT_228196 [Polychaeton citri CBS 116435]|uniref:Lipid droplet-associated hydrolase n=1 Tax=Polychaeton citri CBS 116435 TaxID=1314669 RepID=A0A9P4UNP1_9PEZI|nr:hypothetical protein K431DRAFT_228196 [Polychaeton citri CBS 116435]